MADTPAEQRLLINAQYIKDLSFENPNAPDVYAALAQSAPELTVNIDVTPVHLEDRTYEIILNFRIEAMAGERTAFLVELDYAGLVTVGPSVPEAELEPLLLSETPRHLFPFARSMLAAVTREGGFPPLVINPINFAQFYQRRKKNTLKAAAPKATPEAAPKATPEAAPEG